MRLAILILLLPSGALAEYVGTAGGDGIIECMGPGGGTFTGDVCFQDDVELGLGGCPTSDYAWHYDSSDTRLELNNLTGLVAKVEDGTVNLDLSGNLTLLDTKTLTLGTTNQATLTHDGTDLVLDPDAVGAGVLSVTGNVAVPTLSYFFADTDRDSGFYCSSDDVCSFFTGGVGQRRMTFDTNTQIRFNRPLIDEYVGGYIGDSVDAINFGSSCTPGAGWNDVGDAAACGDLSAEINFRVGGTSQLVGVATFEAAPVFAAYQRHFPVEITTSALGPSAPGSQIVGTSFYRCFDADAEKAYFRYQIPPDWDGVSDMSMHVHWTNEDGTPIPDTETVKWVFEFRTLADGEIIDYGHAAGDGSVYTNSVTYTQTGGVGTDKAELSDAITIDYDNTNQPLTSLDEVVVVFYREKTGDTYANDACAGDIHIDYTSNALPHY